MNFVPKEKSKKAIEKLLKRRQMEREEERAEMLRNLHREK